MDESQFLELSKNFRNIKERLTQLPSIIDDLMAKELNLRRIAHLNNKDELKDEIARIKKEREKLHTEIIEKKAILPILRKQLIDASKTICDSRIRYDANKIDEYRESIKSTKMKLNVSINDIVEAFATLWGSDRLYERLMEYVSLQLVNLFKNKPNFPKIGMEEQLANTINRQKIDQETLRQLLQISALDRNTDSIQSSGGKTKEDNMLGLVDDLLDSPVKK